MSKSIDGIAESLDEVASDGDLERVRVAAVEDGDRYVDVVLELPSTDRFTHTLEKPPVWGTNCALSTLLSAYDLEHTELKRLVGERVPCTRRVEDGSLEIEVDVDALEEERTSKTVSPSDFGDLEL